MVLLFFTLKQLLLCYVGCGIECCCFGQFYFAGKKRSAASFLGGFALQIGRSAPS
jgi:hypothetical protein